MKTRSSHRLVAELAILRIAAGVARADIAEACGVTEDAVGRWERGIANPLLHHLDTYARALGVRIVLEDLDD